MAVTVAAFMPVYCAYQAKKEGFRKPASQGGYDNGLPRQWLNQQEGFSARANAAQANCFEALPFFYVALVLAHVMGGSPDTLALWAWVWVLLRAAFIYLYLKDKASLRSLVWTLAFFWNTGLLWMVPFAG